MWTQELKRIEEKSLIKSPQMTGMPFGRGISDPTGDLATELAETKAIVEGKLLELQLQRKKMMQYITTISDSFMRQILFYRHVSCMNWNQVAMNIGGGNTADGVRKAHKRFLEKQK